MGGNLIIIICKNFCVLLDGIRERVEVDIKMLVSNHTLLVSAAEPETHTLTNSEGSVFPTRLTRHRPVTFA